MLRRKIFRNMKSHTSQYLGSIALIIISCLTFSLFLTAGLNLQANLSEFRQSHAVEEAHFMVQEPLSDLDEWEERYDLLLEERKSADADFGQDAVLRLLGDPLQLNRYALLEGEPLTGPDELLIDPDFAKMWNLSIGDKLEVFGQTLIIRGYMSVPDYIYSLKTERDVLKNPQTFGVATIPSINMEQISTAQTFYSVGMNETSSDELMTNFKAELHAKHHLIKWVDQAENNRITFVDGDVQGSILIGQIFPIALLVLTMVLVNLLIWRLLKREYTQIGTLYALGLRKNEILRHYLLIPLTLSLLGGILGTGCGMIGVGPLVDLFASYYNLPIIQLRYYIGIQLLSLLLPFLFLVPFTWFIVARVLRLTPLQLMRGREGDLKVGRVEKKISLDRLSFKVKFQIRELIRGLPRAVLMSAGAAFASMLFLFGFVMTDSMDALLQEDYQHTFMYEHQYTFATFQTDIPAEGEKLSLAPFYSPQYRDGDKEFLVYGVEPQARLIRLVDQRGNQLSLDQVIMTKPLAEKMSVREGDEVELEHPWNGRSERVVVERIAETYTGDLIYMPLSAFNELSGYPPDSYLQLVSDHALQLDDAPVLTHTTKQEMLDGYQALIQPMRAMVAGLAAVAFLIGWIIMHIVFSMTIEENREKISLLKIMGYRKKEVFALVLGGNKWFILLGFTVSIPLIFLAMKGMFALIALEMGVSFPTTIKWMNLLLVFGLVWFIYFVSKWLNRSNLHSIPMDETLKSMRE